MTTWHGIYNENLPFKRRYNAIMARGERVIVEGIQKARPGMVVAPVAADLPAGD